METFTEPKQMTYFCKFDSEGRRTETRLSVDITDPEGYTELTEEQMQYLWGNVDQGENGTGYICLDGKIVSAPPLPTQEPVELPPTLEERVNNLEDENTDLRAYVDDINDALMTMMFGNE